MTGLSRSSATWRRVGRSARAPRPKAGVSAGAVQQASSVKDRPASQRDPDSGGAALPNSHQPDAVESKIGNLIPVAVGNCPKINSPAFGPAECFQPGPGVDLVEIGL